MNVRSGITGGVILVAALAGLGCGVSKQVYEEQVVRGQGAEARAADLDERLRNEAERRAGVEADLAACREAATQLKARLDSEQARVGDAGARLSACETREGALRADLDLSGKARRDLEEQLGSARRDLTALGEEREGLRRQLEASRGSVADLEARVAVIEDEKARTEREKREKLDEISRTYEGLLEGMKDEVQRGRVTISQLRGKLTVNLLDEILFDSGSAAVKPAGQEVLGRLGEVLEQAADKAIVIEGHTDDVPISGALAARFPSNWELSTARATSVVRYLQEAAGIDPRRLAAMGFGPYRPVDTNETPEGRSRNRRIEVKLVPLEAPLLTPPNPEGAAESAPEAAPQAPPEAATEAPPQGQ